MPRRSTQGGSWTIRSRFHICYMVWAAGHSRISDFESHYECNARPVGYILPDEASQRDLFDQHCDCALIVRNEWWLNIWLSAWRGLLICSAVSQSDELLWLKTTWFKWLEAKQEEYQPWIYLSSINKVLLNFLKRLGNFHHHNSWLASLGNLIVLGVGDTVCRSLIHVEVETTVTMPCWWIHIHIHFAIAISFSFPLQ